MKQFAVTLALSLLLPMAMSAQTFLDRLQKQQKNQGKVTVTQSAAIDELVNGTGQTATVATPTATKTATPATKTEPASKPLASKEAKTATPTKQDAPHKKAEEKKAETEAAESTAVDTRQKVMAKSYKVTGYRVQAFAGGNTRADRQKAEQARTIIKTHFPDEPVYVHFYSPRWICRVGNYRTYEEAHKMLSQIRELGYKSASIVKGKITVQY